jgi:hypothetical protein
MTGAFSIASGQRMLLPAKGELIWRGWVAGFLQVIASRWVPILFLWKTLMVFLSLVILIGEGDKKIGDADWSEG